MDVRGFDGRVGHWLCASLAIVVGALALAASASADVEPNNWILQAENVNVAGNVSGVVGDATDDDYYVFYVSGIQQLHISSDVCSDVDLLDTDGDDLSEDYTTPDGVNRYFLRVSHDGGYACDDESGKYTVTVNAPGLVPGPSVAPNPLSFPEPNEDAATAFGPLVGDQWYTGVTETENDEDWLTFFVAPGVQQLDIQTILPQGQCCDEPDMRVYTTGDEDREYGQSITVSNYQKIRHTPLTFTGPQQLWIKVDDDTNEPWMLRVTPAAALAPGLPAPVPPPPAEPVTPATPAPQAPKKPKKPACKIVGKRVKRGHALKVTCSGIKSGLRIESRWSRVVSRHRHSIKGKTRWSTVRNSRTTLTTTGRKRGTYKVSLYRNGKKVGGREIFVK